MQGDGAWLQQMQAADIADQGSFVTLADGVTQVPALYITDEKEFQKYVPSDGNLLGRGKAVVLFVFDGAKLGKILGGDVLTFEGVRYTVNTPVWPQYEQNVCNALACSCYVP